jgi:predicted enzyme related to lactoylglutathione lyase
LWLLSLFLGVVGLEVSTSQSKAEERVSLTTSALKVNVEDMEKALSFYEGKLGFEVAERGNYPQQVVLKTNDRFKLILNKVERLQKIEATDTQVTVTLQVNDLDQAIEKMKSRAVAFGETEKRKEAVGNAIYILDPFGRRISMMHETIAKVEPFKEPKIYNFGIYVPDMNAARDFYVNKLGFVARSEKYLPLDLPLGHSDKTFAFMLHYRPGINPIKTEYPKAAAFLTVVLETADLGHTVNVLKSNNVTMVALNPSKHGLVVGLQDPFGNVLELVQAQVR